MTTSGTIDAPPGAVAPPAAVATAAVLVACWSSAGDEALRIMRYCHGAPMVYGGSLIRGNVIFVLSGNGFLGRFGGHCCQRCRLGFWL